MPNTRRSLVTLASLLLAAVGAPAALGADPVDAASAEQSLGRYFGFDEPRFIVVDQGLGPIARGDFNADGRTDLAIVNNRKSRLEVHLQRETARSADPAGAVAPRGRTGANELPPSDWFDRVDIPLRQRVSAIAAHDVNADDRADILFAGEGGEFVVLRQGEDGSFTELARSRVFGLAATKDGLKIAEVMGRPGDRPEVVTLVNGRIRVYPITQQGRLGEPVELGANDGTREQIVGVYTADFTGDGLIDIVGVAPDNAFPIRLWAQEKADAASEEASTRRLGPELRFESAPLRDAQPVPFGWRGASSLAVVERSTNRVMVYDFVTEPVEAPSADARATERDVQAEILPLPGAGGAGGGASGPRPVVVADITDNGLVDLVSVDAQGNATLLFPQKRGGPVRKAERFPSLKNPKAVAAGQWDGEGPLEVFVLSEDEKTVGVSAYEGGRLSFPQPITLATAGATPQALAFVNLGDAENPRPALAVVVELRREVTLELHEPGAEGGARAIKLEGVRRAPSAVIPADVDQDGAVDLLLLTPGEPMLMVQGASGETSGELRVLTDKQMPQFGLVQAAGPDNTALLDVDGDGKEELLIADSNFVRAARFDAAAGWRVVEQAIDPERRASFSALTVMDNGRGAPRLVAGDKSSRRLVMFERENEGAWTVVDRVRIAGVEPASLYAGQFSGDAQPNLLVLSGDAMGIVRLGGERTTLQPVASWRADSDRRLDHDLEAGDVNGDGFTDLVVLDAGEKMASILTFTRQRQVLFATEFEVFQSRLFEQERQSDLQPSTSFIADLTGDGAADLCIVTHDRVIIYPQMTGPVAPQ